MNVTLLREQANEALRGGDVQRAIECFREATRLQPENVDLYHELAECHWVAYEFDKALKSYEDAHRVATSPINTCTLAAKKLFGLARFREAARWMKKAVACAPQDAALLTMLGEVYERGNQLADAERCANEALSLAPQNVKAVRLMAHIERRHGQFDDARKRLATHLTRFSGPEDWRLRYELAAVLDRMGEYDAAIQELFKAKEQLRPQAIPCLAQAQAIRQRQLEVAGLLNRADFEAWHTTVPARSQKVSVAFLCGHPRSGTTLLEQILAAHDGAISTDETGVLLREFIDPIVRQPGSAADSVRELRDLDAGQIAEGRATYLRFTEAHLGEVIGTRLLIDKDPALTPDLPLPLRLFPEASIIFPLRDPRDVCVSYFFTLIPLAASSAAALDLRSTCEFCAHSLNRWAHWKKTLPHPLLETRYETLSLVLRRRRDASRSFWTWRGTNNSWHSTRDRKRKASAHPRTPTPPSRSTSGLSGDGRITRSISRRTWTSFAPISTCSVTSEGGMPVESAWTVLGHGDRSRMSRPVMVQRPSTVSRDAAVTSA
jgi:Flp pilus assembly protein TadD